ncbi:hypothetical protein [Streptomyces sp. NPDC050504]|uniref:hypothetical protein n=1 Tax=Streptomyces sp. NPDC050504 TaxID=3365618 RepID=UPI0037A93C0F
MLNHVQNRLRTVARSAGVAAAGAALAVGVGAGTANAAAYNWSATNTSADIVGAYGWGTVDQADRFFVEVNVRDTASDSHGARVYLKATYNDGGVRTENRSASGLNDEDSYTYNFAGNVIKFEVQECLTEGGAKYRCAGWHKIYPR